MKKQNQYSSKNFLKKMFIKICRILGYEIIDQSNFYVSTQEKNLNENLNIQGKKSINLLIRGSIFFWSDGFDWRCFYCSFFGSSF